MRSSLSGVAAMADEEAVAIVILFSFRINDGMRFILNVFPVPQAHL